MKGKESATWRGRAALGVFGVWALLSAARLSRVVEPAEPPPGQALAPLVAFFRATIPPDAGYLFVMAQDNGDAQRLRYELYPRLYDKVRGSQDESTARQLMLAEGLRFVVVPDARQYPSASWLRQPRDWLRRIELDANTYVLELVT
jgi:hypothetical protein